MSLGDGTVIVGHVGIAVEEDIDAIGVKIHFMNVLQELKSYIATITNGKTK